MKFLKLLRLLDIFGYQISVSFKKKTIHKTKCGGFLSLTLFFFILGLSLYCLFRLFNDEYKENYTKIKRLSEDFGSLPLTGENFMLAVKFDNDLLNDWDNPLLNIALIKTTEVKNHTFSSLSNTRITLNKCEAKHFKGLEHEFSQLNLANALCPDISTDLTLEGGFEQKLFTYLKYEITLCRNSPNCQDYSKIAEALFATPKLRFTIYLINTYIDEFNIDKPITRKINSNLQFLIDPSRSVYRTADIFLSELIIDTDHGYTPSIFEQKFLIKNYTYEGEIREQTVSFPFQNNSQETIAEFYFRKSETSFIFQRKIGNLLTILSYLGGIWSSLFIFLFPFIQQYNKHSFLNKLSNKIYNFPNQIKQKKMIMYTQSTFRPITILENGIDRLSPHTNYDFFLNKIKDYFRYDRKLRTNFFEILQIIFYSLINFLPWKPKPKIDLLLESKNSLLEDLDIYNILRRLQDCEKLKTLLFNSDQIKILNFSPKPNIRIPLRRKNKAYNFRSGKGGGSKKLFCDHTNYDNVHVFEELIQTWTHLKKNDSNCKLNLDLCKMFGEEFSTMFDLSEEYIETYLLKKGSMESEGSEENFNNCEEKY